METSTDTTQDPARCQQPIVRLLRLYAPKRNAEALLYRMDWQKDPLPKAGIWEAIGAEELDTDPLIHLRCLAPWDERFPFMHTLKVREKLMALCFERVEIVRSPLQPNVSDQTPRTQDVANTTDGLERLSASVLFVPGSSSE